MKRTKVIGIVLILFLGLLICGKTFAVDSKMLGAELNRPFSDDNGDTQIR